MTKARKTIPRRATEGPLGVNAEMTAAGYMNGFWREPGSESRSFWASIAHTHGDRIRDKVREAMPGCRPGFEYATGKYPPIPLISDPPPPADKAATYFIDIDGVRFWYCGRFSSMNRWQPSQADYLRSIGEVDGDEWKRYLAWKRTRFESRYVLDGANHRASTLAHLCY